MSGRGERPPGMGFLDAAAVIFRMAIAVGLLALVGDWLDRALRTSPWFLVAGIVLGVAAVLFDLQRRAGSSRRRARKKRGIGRGR